jgi:hypothetical protein
MDFAGGASVSDTNDELNFNSATYTLGAVTVGCVFMAPTSGSVTIAFYARFSLNTSSASRILVTPEVRTGAVLGSGTAFMTAGDDNALETGQTATTRVGASGVIVVSGLTPGSTYNVTLLYKNATAFASAGSIFARQIHVTPAFE